MSVNATSHVVCIKYEEILKKQKVFFSSIMTDIDPAPGVTQAVSPDDEPSQR